MAITTLAGIRNGLQPRVNFAKNMAVINAVSPWISSWGGTGHPTSGAYDSTLNGVTLSAPQTGQFRYVNPPSGNSYLARFKHAALGSAVNSGAFFLCDRLWHNGNYTITSTSAQSSTTPTWPARDINGSTNGDGVFLCLEISATVGAATPTITIDYTNQSGTASRTGVNVMPTASGAVTGFCYPITLQAGDTGVRSVQSLTLSASWVSGTINLVAYRPIAFSNGALPGSLTNVDAILAGLPRIYDDSVLYMQGPWILQTGGNATPWSGEVDYTFG